VTTQDGSETITYYIGGYYSEEIKNGGSPKIRLKYSFGSETIAVRTIQGPSENTLNWIMTDNLNTTTVTAHAHGTWNSEICYTAFGEIRFTGGATPTQYRFRGQLACHERTHRGSTTAIMASVNCFCSIDFPEPR